MKALRNWLAGGPRPSEDAVLVLAPPGVPTAGAIGEALTGGGFRVSTVIVAAGRDEAARLAARFPGALVRVPPAAAPAEAVLAALRVRAVLAVAPERLGGRPARLFRAALARGVPVYALRDAGEDVSKGSGGTGGSGDFAAAGASLELELLSGVGTPPAGPLTPEGAAGLLARATGVERDPRLSVDRLAARVARLGPGRISGGFVRRIDSVEALRDRLGAPGTVLCLGNGPSSADPAVVAFAHDALFRVNVDWRGGAVLTRPDMVFVGVKRAMRRLGPVPLGVATPRKESALLACRLFEPWHGPAVYAVAETLAADVIPPVRGGLKPTTGAYMLAVAVALAPGRLAVAGMDMFSHPAGAYSPGTDPTAGGSVNAFAASHDFETDAAFIAACLSRFAGELVVFSPALAALLRERCPDAPFALVDRGDAQG